MGRWVYVEDKKNTSVSELRKMHTKLITASMKSKIDVKIEFSVNQKELDKPCVYITFFNSDKNFSIDFYTFDSHEGNNKKLELALNLIKDSSKFQKTREQYEEMRFN